MTGLCLCNPNISSGRLKKKLTSGFQEIFLEYYQSTK
jgi:hypothetical protein